MKPVPGREWKIFDPRDAATGLRGAELLDATVVRRGEQWWMYVAGQASGYGPTDLFSASLGVGEPLSASGWRLTRALDGQLVPLADRNASRPWDGNGGRHCPSHVMGFDPHKQKWVERIYCAGAADNLWGPYTIGFLELEGDRWVDRREPVFLASEEWERGSVFEPNLIYYDGKWRMWYVAGSHQDDYLVQGYVESIDGCGGWSEPVLFAPAEMRMFDFRVVQRAGAFEAIFARVWVKEGPPPAETGLWWARANTPGKELAQWSEPVQILTAEDRGWHSGPWKPSVAFDEQSPERALVFFDGLYRTTDPGPFPFAFTLGCLELSFPLE